VRSTERIHDERGHFESSLQPARRPAIHAA
jgi:hypothetical protein